MSLICERGEGMKINRLVKRAKKGNKKALLQLIMKEQDAYYKLAFTYMKNKHDAMDVMANMIVILYEKIATLEKNEAFYSWSKTILVNECKTLLRRRKKVVLFDKQSVASGEVIEEPVVTDHFKQTEQHIDIETMLSHVSEVQRETIQLKYFHDLDNRTIAKITGVSIGTVKSRLYYGLRKLQTMTGRDMNEVD